MKISDTLYEAALDLWDKAADKPFVKEMAKGSLDEGLFRRFMIQDYLYLLDYIDILKFIQEQTGEPEMRDFLQNVIKGTENETYRVHVPHMKSLGISEEEAAACTPLPVITEYIGYMHRQVKERGLIAGLTALLQCSWVYAYIGEKMTSTHADEISRSPYRFWFEAYTCREYLDSNQVWIDVLDREASGVSSEEAAVLGEIFRTCAEYEIRLWDALHDQRTASNPTTL